MSPARRRWALAWLGAAMAAAAAGVVAVACGVEPDSTSSHAGASYSAGPPDDSHSLEQHITSLKYSAATLSLPLRDIGPISTPPRTREHEVHYPAVDPTRLVPDMDDPVVQTKIFPQALSTTLNFLGQGDTLSPTTVTGDPPDPNGAVGPNHYVQAVNGGLAIWNKSGTLLWGSKSTNVLWTGYGTADGNSCATEDDGDAVVVYDGLADRWFITQFDVPNDGLPDGGEGVAKSWQCIAVSETSDPTGAYYLYDFEYPYIVNDYGKFGIWSDGYYATYNMFGATSYKAANFVGAAFCAFNRSNMLQGLATTEQCVQNTAGDYYGSLPVTLEGQVAPPTGEPGYFLGPNAGGSGSSSLNLFKYSVSWTTPSSTTLTGPTVLTAATFTNACSTSNTDCIPQKGSTEDLDSLNQHAMFRLPYRNFGTHEAILANESVKVGTGSTAHTGVRWYELRSALGGASWSIFQQGTFSPDNSHRWMASIAQDQAEDFGLGYSISSSTLYPEIGITGRVVSDTAGTMGQGETVIFDGPNSQQTYFRWGDYSSMTVDPADDCTFWYTNEYYGISTNNPDPFNWQSRVASFKFANCAANDFGISVAEPPSGEDLPRSGSSTYQVTTTSIAGTAETITLSADDLPSGVTASFSPATITAGSDSTLTLTATAGATTGLATFTVIGTATSACHPTTGQVVVTPAAAACTPGNQGVWCWDTSLGAFTYGPLGMNSEGFASEVSMVGGQISEFAFASGANQFHVGALSTASTRAVPVQFTQRNGVANVSDALFFGTTDGFVYRVNSTTGACAWRASIARGSGGTHDYLVDSTCGDNAIPNACSDSVQLDPAVLFTGDDHTSFVIVGTRNGATSCSSTTASNRVYAFEADTGSFSWEYDPESIKLGAITSLYPDVYADGCSTQRDQIVVGSLAPGVAGPGALLTINAATGAQIAVDSTTGYATAVAAQGSLALDDTARCGHLYSAGTGSVYVGTVTGTSACTTPPCELTTYGSGTHSYSNVSVSRSHLGQIVVRQDGNILLLQDSGGSSPTLTLDCSYTPSAGSAVGDPGSLSDHFYFGTSQGAVIELPFDNGSGAQTTNGGGCIGAKVRQFSATPATTSVADPSFDFNAGYTLAYLFVGDGAGRIEAFNVPFVSAN